MKLLFTILFVSTILASLHLEAQTRKDKFKDVTIVNKDQSIFRAWIDLDQLVQEGKLTSRDSVFQRYTLAAIYSIQVDSSVYLLKSIGNRNDSIAILSRAIEGKVSVYTPPLESGLEAIFVEKDGATFEMRRKVVEVNGLKFYQNEFRGFLQAFFSDCKSITKAMVDKVPFGELPIMKIISRYNKSCGWEKTNRANKYRAKFQYGLQLEGVHYNSTKGAYENYFKGDRPASGFGLGLYARVDFARKKTAFLVSELTFNHISGGGEITYYVTDPEYQIFTEHHNFNIQELRNTYSVYFNIVRFKKSTLAAGGGMFFQYQLKNNSTVTDRKVTTLSAKPQDKFGFCPIINVLFNMNGIGFGYQVVFMAAQLKGTEDLHIEHKVYLQIKLLKK
ncbi:MAG TPA: hypothetical protein VL443_10440 [Cyclobacteriaceae bacterium]|jgi:hypothetical protein|nr:hypothetical protein [Cyclobacteriaceae bacterium]